MNSPRVDPHHGAVTDVNIWDRILSEQEVSDWMFCKTETGGNVISWETAQLNVLQLKTDLIDREKTCPSLGSQHRTHLLAFNTKIGLDDSVAFCEKLDGQLAVVTDQETFSQMWATYFEVCPLEEGGEREFFTGHTDREVEGEWRDVNTGDLVTWANHWASWARDQPDGGTQCSPLIGQNSLRYCVFIG